MLIKSSDSTKISIPEGTIWDYPMPNEDVGISYQTLNGRVPTKGRGVNTVCQEIYFVISGTATIYLGDKHYSVGSNDIVVIEPNIASHLEGANDLKIITITRPNWYEKQYKIVED